MGSIALYPVLFLFFFSISRVHGRVFPRADRTRAREYLLPLSGGMRGADLIRDENGLIT